MSSIPLPLPSLETNHRQVNQAWQVAIGDLIGNIQPMKIGLLKRETPVIQAGLVYEHPWTRDAAINVWNGCCLLYPEISKNTLESVLEIIDGKLQIGGQYWDSIIWANGAWQLYLATKDKYFLNKAYKAITNTIMMREKKEFSFEFGLFRGGGCFLDGISGYPDMYADTIDLAAGIENWNPRNPKMKYPIGKGFPAHCLSTNCLYYEAYKILELMATELNIKSDIGSKANNLKKAIQKHFWIEDKGRYRFLVDKWGIYDIEEGLGNAFLILFGIVDEETAKSILKKQTVTKIGLFPCMWPSFDRYTKLGPGIYGRHSGTVWPHVNAFLAEAAARVNEKAIFSREFLGIAKLASRDGQFAEIYHPETGRPYGGVQENGSNYDLKNEWFVGRRQTWCATGFIRMVLYGLLGLTLDTDKIHFKPCIPEEINNIKLTGIKWRNSKIKIHIEGNGEIKIFYLDGKESPPFIYDDEKNHHVKIICS